MRHFKTRDISASVLVLGLAVLAGCQARVARRQTEPTLGHAGSAWEAALPAAMLARSPQDPRALPEFSRNDASLNPRHAQPVLATGQWPESPRPDLSHTRRLYLNPRADVILYTDPQPALDRRDRPTGWNWWW